MLLQNAVIYLDASCIYPTIGKDTNMYKKQMKPPDISGLTPKQRKHLEKFMKRITDVPKDMDSDELVAFSALAKILGYFMSRPRPIIETGRKLNEIKKKRTYRQLGYGTFEEYIKSPDNKNGRRRRIYGLMKLSNLYDEKLSKLYSPEEINRIGYSKLSKIAREIERTNDSHKIRRLCDRALESTHAELLGGKKKYPWRGTCIIEKLTPNALHVSFRTSNRMDWSKESIRMWFGTKALKITILPARTPKSSEEAIYHYRIELAE